MRWFFRVEYDGSAFAGWQTQANAHSVQAELEKAFSIVVRRPCRVVGAGRTDAGVHARGQGAHIDAPDGVDIAQYEASVNAILPPAIAVRQLRAVSETFHARFSARERTYAYYIVTHKAPLWRGRAWFVPHRIDWKLIAGSLPSLLGRHDFRAFCASNHSAHTTICTVKQARIRTRGELKVILLSADRFLYKMVRSIVGTLIDIGRGAIDEPLGEILSRGDRRLVGETAPPYGLVLENVAYDDV